MKPGKYRTKGGQLAYVKKFNEVWNLWVGHIMANYEAKQVKWDKNGKVYDELDKYDLVIDPVKPGYYWTASKRIAVIKETNELFAFGFCAGHKTKWLRGGFHPVNSDYDLTTEYTLIRPGEYRTIDGRIAKVKFYSTTEELWHGTINDEQLVWYPDGRGSFGYDIILEKTMTIYEAIEALKQGKRVKHDTHGEVYLRNSGIIWKKDDSQAYITFSVQHGWSIIKDKYTDYPIKNKDGYLSFVYNDRTLLLADALSIDGFMCYVYDKGPVGMSPCVTSAKTIAVRIKND